MLTTISTILSGVLTFVIGFYVFRVERKERLEEAKKADLRKRRY
jgi:hypothetical protein